MKLKTLAAAVAAFTALSSQASSWNWGAHDALELGGNTVTGAIFDTFSFSLGSSASVSSGVLSFGTIVGGAYSLYSTGGDGLIGGGDDVGIGAWTFSGAPATHTVSLGAGSYYYSVLGGASGTASYALASATTPVPEPETYALLAAGLGIIGFVSSRRRRDDR